MILCEAVAKFISHCRYGKNLSPKTLTAYSTDLRQFAAHLGDQAETLSLEALDKTYLRDFIQSLFGGNADKTIKRKVATLKAFFHFLEERTT